MNIIFFTLIHLGPSLLALICVKYRALSPRSAQALFIEGKDHADGGVAYLRRVVCLTYVESTGVTIVEASQVLDVKNVFHRGKIAIGFNHTKVCRMHSETFSCKL